MQTESVKNCPVCKCAEFFNVLHCKDHTYSHEKFAIQECKNCHLFLTSPRPDEDSIGNFYSSDEYISHTGRSTSIFDKLYIWVRSFTLKWKRDLIQSRKTVGALLDYGCGTGEFVSTMIKANWDAYGIEPAAPARQKAIELINLENKVIFGTPAELPSRKYDLITLWHVLEHVPNPNELLSTLKSMLQDGGLIFVAVPNHESFDAEYYQEHWAAYDLPRHFWHFSSSNMAQLLNQNGLKLKQTIPMKLDAFYVSLLSEKYKNDGKHTLLTPAKALLTGIRSNAKARKTNNYSSLIYIASHA
ncbi:MAG: class I SAM-dependent methyltransferase [Cyclobacteriaceae bacterium]